MRAALPTSSTLTTLTTLTTLATLTREALLDAWALVAPIDCAGCGAHDRAVCAGCTPHFAPALTTHELGCGTRVVAALRYEGVVRRAILALKENDRTDAAAALARPLGSAVVAAASLEPRAVAERNGRAAPAARRIEVLAAPSGVAAFRRRGYNPAALLARAAGFRPVTPLAPLGPARGASAQKSLDLAARHANRAHSLRSRIPLDGRVFVVVDDVLTTGATLAEVVRATREAGGTVVGAAVVAFTPRRLGASAGDLPSAVREVATDA